MKPISRTFNQNCEFGMAQSANKRYGLAVPDPPYFTGPESGAFYGGRTS